MGLTLVSPLSCPSCRPSKNKGVIPQIKHLTHSLPQFQHCPSSVVRNGESHRSRGRSDCQVSAVEASRVPAGGPTVDLNPNLLPPGRVRTFMLAEADSQAIPRDLAVEVHAQAGAALVRVGLAVVQVKAPGATVAGVDPQGKRTFRCLI